MLKVFEAQNCYKAEGKGLKSIRHSLSTSMIKILSKNVWFLVSKVPAPLMIFQLTLQVLKLKGAEVYWLAESI